MGVTLIAGDLELNGERMPGTVLSCGAGHFEGTFFSMAVVGTSAEDGRDIWKVFSAAVLTQQQLATVFRLGYRLLLVHPWEHCFPDLSPQVRYPPMRIAQGCWEGEENMC